LRKTNNMTNEEEKLQNKCYMWYHNELIHERKMLFHVDNNSWNAIIGSRKKALGVQAGVSDFILITVSEIHFIEMKTPKGIQDAEQIKFQKMVEERGHKYYIISTFEEFKELILNLIFKSERKWLNNTGK